MTSVIRAVLVIILLISFTGLVGYASAFVNIVSPEKGEAVPAGSTLTVTGTSDDNAQFNCNIQIIVNGHQPYQDTIPVAPGDYSDWTFVITPQYGEIEAGINTITSKATCDAPYEAFLKLDPLTRQYEKHYSINVTGVPSGTEGGASPPGPFIFPAPSEDEDEDEDEGGGEEEEAGETDGGGNGDEDSTSGDSLFG